MIDNEIPARDEHDTEGDTEGHRLIFGAQDDKNIEDDTEDDTQGHRLNFS